MPRIRSIKPEFPQSESMGRVSRDARLLFILLWTIADDHGRTRAHSRMLASLLFPYDDDAGNELPKWITELEKEGCIRVYEAHGSQYLHIVGWTKHQKIDKPSKAQFPGPDDDTREDSRDTREDSENTRLGKERKGRDQGPRKGREEEHESTNVDSGPSTDVDAPPRSPPIPYQAIADAYNRELVNLPKVRDLTPKRRTAIRTAWQANTDRRSVEFWTAYFEESAEDPFLNGTGPYKNGHENWRPSFDYLIRADVITRVSERAMDRVERCGVTA